MTTAWLAGRLGDPNLRIVDASHYKASEGRDPPAEFEAGHIPGAAFFSLKGVSDPANPYPLGLPSPVQFAEQVGALGLGDGRTIVAYDTAGLYSAARVWWMFRTMGHEDVFVLDGGMRQWRAEGRPLETGPATPKRETFTPRYDASLYRDTDQVAAAVRDGVQVYDTRGGPRFRGQEVEARVGVRRGHIPGTKNLHWAALLGENGRVLPAADLQSRFDAAGLDADQPLISTCGSGVTACILSLAMARLGRWDTPVYDGSWTEWGARHELPVATGP